MNYDEVKLIKAQRARLAYAESAGKARERLCEAEAVAEELLVSTSAGSTSVLLYKPKPGKSEPLPVFVNIHGGGFIQGGAEDDDAWCRRIADAVGCAVVNIDYHLAPEYPFPAALEECYDVVEWISAEAAGRGLDAAKIAVGGSSAGGNLAAALCFLARERKQFSIVCQVLNYPVLDLATDPCQKPASDRLLTPKAQAFFTSCYVGEGDAAKNPLASPLLAESFAGLPDALIISAEKDPLRGENELFAERLAAAGVTVTYRMFKGCHHAFTHFGPKEAAKEAWSLIHEKLRQAFG